jgi:SAM-dependent methyltransferase
MIDLDTAIRGSRPTYGGVTFASKPAALRQLQMVREIATRLGDTPGAIGLEVGAKLGDLSSLLDGFGIRCIRLDVQDREDRRGLILGDGQQLPFRTACLDFVVLSNVLAHVDDVEAFVAETKRTVKPGGHLFILQSNRWGWWKFWGYYMRRNDRAIHLRTFDLWGLKELLGSNSFTVERMFAPYHFYLQAKNWDALFRLDRRLEGRVPLAVATAWMVVARRAQHPVTRPGLASRWPLPLVALATPFHSIALKFLDVAIRAVLNATGKTPAGEEAT